MFLLSCMAIYSDDINSQSESNSFSSKIFKEVKFFNNRESWKNREICQLFKG